MECQDVRQLLAFLDRPSEELDAPEREALQKHLDACPDCSALAAQERGVDQAIGTAVRTVPIPAGLKQQVLGRLSRERGRSPWQRWALPAAMALLLAIAAGTAWTLLQKPVLTPDDISAVMPTAAAGMHKDAVEDHLAQQGVTVRAPEKFNYRWLQQADVVILQGRRVARLTFTRNDASATVFILPAGQFDIEGLRGTTEMIIEPGEGHQAGFTNIIRYTGDLQRLEKEFN